MLTITKFSPPIPYEELLLLLKDAYAERLKAGLNFSCATFNVNDLKRNISENAVILGAYKDNTLIGMGVLNSIRSKYGLKFGTTEFGAVASKYKHQGVGSAILKERIQEAKKQNLDFIFSDTAVPAISAIKYHKKIGFKEYGFTHYTNRTYDSVNFILPLTFKGRLIASWLGRKILKILFTNR